MLFILFKFRKLPQTARRAKDHPAQGIALGNLYGVARPVGAKALGFFAFAPSGRFGCASTPRVLPWAMC